MDDVIDTQVLRINPADPDPQLIRIAAEHVVRGRLVAFPTETVYGLGANAFDADAIRLIFSTKNRPASDPIIVHIAALAQLAEVARAIPDTARLLAQRFWPGPLTLVLQRHHQVPAIVSAGLATIAVRMPSHPVALALLREVGVPIAAPSANTFARPSPTTARHVLEDLQGRIDIVLDAGPTTIGLESTVIDLTQEVPTVLRPGGIALEAVREIIPAVRYKPSHTPLEPTSPASVSPGMLAKHYAPRAELLLFTGSLEPVLVRMRETAERLVTEHKKVGILAPEEECAYFAGIPALVVSLGSRTDLGQIGRHLFAGMRELDQSGMDTILVRGFDQQGLGLAIWDRLFRATEGRVIEVDQHSAD